MTISYKVIGIPQPTLTWYKDDKELRAGDLHQLMAGSNGKSDDPKTCVFGKYACVAENCMGQSISTATLLGLSEDTANNTAEDVSAASEIKVSQIP